MPVDRELADVETLLVDYLLADATFNAFVDGRISTKLPSTFEAEKRVRLYRAGGSEVDAESGEVDRALISTQNFGADDVEAFAVARKTLVMLRRTVTMPFDGAVITKAQRALGPLWSPDPETNAPRYLLDVLLTVHPTA